MGIPWGDWEDGMPHTFIHHTTRASAFFAVCHVIFLLVLLGYMAMIFWRKSKLSCFQWVLFGQLVILNIVEVAYYWTYTFLFNDDVYDCAYEAKAYLAIIYCLIYTICLFLSWQN